MSENIYQIGDVVRYHGKWYRILSVTLHGIAGPHYRLKACGEYPNEELTSHELLHRPVTLDARP